MLRKNDLFSRFVSFSYFAFNMLLESRFFTHWSDFFLSLSESISLILVFVRFHWETIHLSFETLLNPIIKNYLRFALSYKLLITNLRIIINHLISKSANISKAGHRFIPRSINVVWWVGYTTKTHQNRFKYNASD